MNNYKLQDKIHFGLGKTAKHLGAMADAYRAADAFQPLDQRNRFLKLPAWFTSTTNAVTSTNTFGQPLWHGVFDASYTRPGDYLVLKAKIYFIAAQEPLLPVLCVLANRMISISRPKQQALTSTNPYGGYTFGASTLLMSGFPACVLSENKSGPSLAYLPTDQALASWYVLLPAPAGVLINPGDLLCDDLGRNAVVTGSELTSLGWRINAKMAMT